MKAEQFRQVCFESINKYGEKEFLKRLKSGISKAMPKEIGETLNEFIDEGKPDTDGFRNRLTDKVLDSYNDGKRTKEEVKTLLSGKKLSKEDVSNLMTGEL